MVREPDGRRLRCENLEVSGELGQPMASRCRVYGQRVDGMPIRMLDAEGQVGRDDMVCGKESLQETLAILERGIGNGCSMQVLGCLDGQWRPMTWEMFQQLSSPA